MLAETANAYAALILEAREHAPETPQDVRYESGDLRFGELAEAFDIAEEHCAQLALDFLA